jgi:hypothetical protein
MASHFSLFAVATGLELNAKSLKRDLNGKRWLWHSQHRRMKSAYILGRVRLEVGLEHALHNSTVNRSSNRKSFIADLGPIKHSRESDHVHAVCLLPHFLVELIDSLGQ